MTILTLYYYMIHRTNFNQFNCSTLNTSHFKLFKIIAVSIRFSFKNIFEVLLCHVKFATCKYNIYVYIYILYIFFIIIFIISILYLINLINFLFINFTFIFVADVFDANFFVISIFLYYRFSGNIEYPIPSNQCL